MQCAEDYVRYCCRHLLDSCRPDLEFINSMIDKGAIARLEQVGRRGAPAALRGLPGERRQAAGRGPGLPGGAGPAVCHRHAPGSSSLCLRQPCPLPLPPPPLPPPPQVANSSFKRVSYTEAIELLEGVVAAGKKKFEFPVSWGIDLQVGVCVCGCTHVCVCVCVCVCAWCDIVCVLLGWQWWPACGSSGGAGPKG